METKSSRIECAATIEELSDTYSDLIHVTSDGTDHFKKHPERCFDVGIAEADLVNVATGFALKGRPVIINAITSFMLYNAYLQIRNNLCYQNLKVIMLGIGSGFSYGHLGFSHHSLEDIAVMSTLPNMKVYLPADPIEAALALKDAMKRNGPSFVRIRSGQEPIITGKSVTHFDKSNILRKGCDVVIFTYGASIYQSLLAAEQLSKNGVEVKIVNVNSINIYSFSKLLEFVEDTHKLIVTVDEHYVKSGLGSMINSVFYDKTLLPIMNLGVKSEFCKIGANPDELEKLFGMDSVSIKEGILKTLKKYEKRK